MIRLLEEDVDEKYINIKMGVLGIYQHSQSKNQPTHYTMTLGDNGFDKVKYYILDLDK